MVGPDGRILLGMGCAVLPEPRHRPGDPLVERHRGVVAEQLARLREIGDVVGHLAEQRGASVIARLDLELGGDPLGAMDERVALPVGEVDRLVDDAPLGEGLDARG